MRRSGPDRIASDRDAAPRTSASASRDATLVATRGTCTGFTGAGEVACAAGARAAGPSAGTAVGAVHSVISTGAGAAGAGGNGGRTTPGSAPWCPNITAMAIACNATDIATLARTLRTTRFGRCRLPLAKSADFIRHRRDSGSNSGRLYRVTAVVTRRGQRILQECYECLKVRSSVRLIRVLVSSR